MESMVIQHSTKAVRVHRANRPRLEQMQPDTLSIAAATLLSCSIALLAMAFSPVIRHWFLLPLTGCGALAGIDLVKWLRKRIDLFDPAGMIGLLGFHFFLLAPLLMVYANYRMHYLPEQPEDYRPWLGYMGVLNFAGLLLYRKTVSVMRTPKRSATPSAAAWAVQPLRFWITWTALTFVSAAMEIWTLVLFGGFEGYVAAYSAWLQRGEDGFQGIALLFAFSDSLPVLLMIGFGVWARGRKIQWPVIVTAFTVFLILDFVSCGLRGSRSNVIWTTFWAAGILHFYVRRIPRMAALWSLVLLYGFVSLYAAYKQHGIHLFTDYTTSGEVSSFNNGVEDVPTVLVGDFSRTDVQANLLWKISQGSYEQYAWGRSYLGALTMLVPRSLWPSRPASVVRWSTDAEYGKGAFESGLLRSTRVYGIVGEAMLNVGPAGVPLALLSLGLLVGTLRRFLGDLGRSDARLLIAPFLINVLFLLLLDDSDNVVFYLVKYGLVPMLLLVFSSIQIVRRVPCTISSHQPSLVNLPLPNTSTVPRSSTLIIRSGAIASR